MKAIYDNGEMRFEYKGYFWRVAQEAIIDTLHYTGIDIINYMRVNLDVWPESQQPQRLILSIEKDIAPDGSWRSHKLIIRKEKE